VSLKKQQKRGAKLYEFEQYATEPQNNDSAQSTVRQIKKM